MTPPQFPFAALVGLETLKLALQLAAIDHRLSVVVRGDKGAGKSTAARGLAALLEGSVPFITLPIGATEDRLLGGLDVEKALRGEPSLKRGLLAEANGGVLYIDEVNLLPDHLADALLDAVASGVHTVEREGFSATQAADFVLLGSMNPEEGALRPQLLDRFALAVDVESPADVAMRCEVLERRLAFDRDPDAFVRSWKQTQESAASALAAARARVASVAVPREMLHYAATRVAEHEVKSLRADLAVVRASRAHAAVGGAEVVSTVDIEAVLPLALAHRMRGKPRSRTPPPPSPQRDDQSRQSDQHPSDGRPPERVFEAVSVAAPRLTIEHGGHAGHGAGRAAGDSGPSVGPIVATRRSDTPRELDLRPSLLRAVTHTGQARLRVEDLHERVRVPIASTRFIMIVDSSGSHAIHDRMRLVKGVASGLLDASHGRHDEVVVIGCRGAQAEVLVEPTSVRDDAARALEYLPTGGRTPLAHGLELAAGYVTDQSLVIVITDGRANVPTRTEDAWADAQRAAEALRCATLVIDTEDERSPTGRPRDLATALRARYARLAELDPAHVLTILRADG